MEKLMSFFLSHYLERSLLLWKRSLVFSKRTVPLLGLIFANAMAEYSFLGFLVVFIKASWDEDNMRLDAVISTARDCFSAFLASFLVCMVHGRIRPFIMILVTHVIFITGMLILLLAPSQMNGIFYLALALLSVNKSGLAYIEDFIDEPVVGGLEQVMDDEKRPDITPVGDLEQVMDYKRKPNITPIDAWWYIGWIVGAITGVVLTSVSSTKLMLMISAIVGGIGCIFFFSYRICYELSLGHNQEDKHDLKHELRALLKLLPLWAPFLIYYVVDAAGSTFFIEQGKALHYHEALMYMLQKIFGFLVSRLITKFLSNQRNQPKWFDRLTQITCGMSIICFLICMLSWHVEASRLLHSIKNQQVPKIIHAGEIFQFVLLGTMNGMVEGTMGEFFYSHVTDESMHHLEFTFNSFVEGMGYLLGVVYILVFRNWIGNTINDSHLDKYYRTLAFMSLWALVMFLCLSKTCYWKKERQDHDSLTNKMEEGRLTSEPQSFSLHSSLQWHAHSSAGESIFTNSEHSLRSSPHSSAYLSADESIFASSEHSLRPSLQSSAYHSAEESHFVSSGNFLQSSPQSSTYPSADESIFISSEQTSLLSNLGSTRPSANSQLSRSSTCPNPPPPVEEIFNDYQRSRSTPNDLRHRPSAKAISQYSEGTRPEIN